MSIKGPRPRRRLGFPLAAFFTTIVAFIGLGQTAVTAAPLRLSIEPERAARGCYQLRVVTPGDPVLVFLDGDVREMQVSAGESVWDIGARAVYGLPPLGIGVSALSVTSTPTVRHVCAHGPIRLTASTEEPRLRQVWLAGGLSGFYIGVLSAIAALLIASMAFTRDGVSIYYSVFVLAQIGIEAVRDGLLPFGPRVGPADSFVILNIIAGFSAAAFWIEFLRLRTAAPLLFRVVLATVIGESLIGLLFITIPILRPYVDAWTVIANVCGTTMFITVALLRGRAGYSPAYYLLSGLSGLMLSNWYLLFAQLTPYSVPFLDRWIFEIGSSTDAVFFAIAISFRSRYTLREHARVKRELESATHDAEHDALTGLLNRRGLERWLETALPLERTLLFIDLDHFKSVNDRGGHDAGDRVLVAVAGIVAKAMRSVDVAARVGGDEFVLIIATTAPARLAAVIGLIEERVFALRPLGDADPTRIGASIGMARFDAGADVAEVLQRADADAYRVKVEHHAASG